MMTVRPVKADKKIVLGLSGGVDSTTACLFLQEKGYDVTGLYFNVLSDACLHGAESRDAGRAKAEKAAEQLGIPLIYKDLSREFAETVIEDFAREYLEGRTPNPCIICNPTIKFRVLAQVADEIGAPYIATGHYAGTYHDENTGVWHIRRAANPAKDQSYMLYRLPQEILSRLVLPLNEIASKDEVRSIAAENNLFNAQASDSQEICFIHPDDSYEDFIRRMGYESPEGDFVDGEGNVLGRHKGIINYTMGQRKGLGIALGKPAFVTGIDPGSNRVTLGDNEDLFRKRVVSRDNLFAAEPEDGMKVSAKIRYAARPADGTLRRGEKGRITCTFEEPQRAPTPGQSIVFYDGDILLGGGFIE